MLLIRCEKCNEVTAQIDPLDKDTKTFECRCSYDIRAKDAMPFFAKFAKPSKIHKSNILLNKLQNDVFLKIWPDDFNAIMHYIYYKYFDKLSIKITDDLIIKDVGVGSANRKSRGENATVVYNSIEDLVAHQKLLIIILGRHKSKNKEVANYLNEAITTRVNYGRLWVVSYKNEPYGQGSPSYSPEIWKTITSDPFEQIDIPNLLHSNSVVASNPTQLLYDTTNDDVVVKIHKEPVQEDLDDSDDSKPDPVAKFSTVGQGINKKKRKFNNS